MLTIGACGVRRETLTDSGKPDGMLLTRMLALVFPALVIVQPLHRQPIDSFYSQWLVLVGVALWFLLRANAGSAFALRLDAFSAAVFAFIAWALTQRATGLANADLAVFHVGYLLLFLLAYQLGQNASVRSGAAVDIPAGVLFAALMAAACAALQASGSSLFELIRPRFGAISGNLGQSNHFNVLLWMGVAAALHLRREQAIRAWIAVLAIGCCFAFSAFTSSRASLLYAATISVLPLFFRYWFASHATRLSSMRWEFCVLPAFLVVYVFLNWSGMLDSLQVVTYADRLREMEFRPIFWRIALAIMTPFGVGVGQVPVTMLDRVELWSEYGFPTLMEHAHNLFVQVGLEYGWIGAIVLIACCGLWLLRLRRSVDHRAHGWMLCAVVMMLIHSQLEFPLWYLYFLASLGFFLGALVAPSPARRVVTIHRPGMIAICGLLTMLSVWSYRSNYVVETALERVSNGMPYDRGERGSPSLDEDISLWSPFQPYAALVRVYGATLKQVGSDEAVRDCRRVVPVWPAPVILGKCAVLTGNADPSGAYELARKGCLVGPKYRAVIADKFRLAQASGHLLPDMPTECLEAAQ